METAPTADESTSLLLNSATSNEHRHLFRIPATFNDQTSLEGNDITSSVDGSCAIFNGEASSCGEGTSNSGPRTFEQETNEVSLEEVVQAMCAAYQRHRRHYRFVGLDFFTNKQLCAMHLAWKSVTRGRHCSSQPHIIAEAVADAIAKLLTSRHDYEEESDLSSYFYIKLAGEKSFLTIILLREWERITEGVGFPVRYIETISVDSDERPPAVSEFWLRQVELYDKVDEFFRRPKLKSFISLLIIWPLSFLVVGSKNMECPMSHHLSCMFIILGCVGCLAIIARLSLMYLTSQVHNAYNLFWEWIGLRLIEFTFFIVFIVQAFYFFDADPTTEPDHNQCMRDFHSAALVINSVSIALVLLYALVICKNRFDFWHWIFRYL